MIARSGHPMRAVRIGLMACVVGAALASPSAHADFQFSADGSSPAVTVSGFTPAVGNALAQGGRTAIANFAAGSGDTTFQLYYQATLQGLVGPGGPIATPGLNSTFEITVIGSITERVTSFDAVNNIVTFALATTQQSQSTLQFYEGAVNANNLAGTGFNDGTLILTATPQLSVNGTGLFQSTPATTRFDQHGADDYGGKQTLVGNGGFTIDFHVNSTNPSFFVTPPPTVIGLEFSGSSSTNFQDVDPSQMFNGGTVTPDLGGPAGINGANGADFQFAPAAKISQVPEPASLALTGFGLIGMVALRRRMRTRV